MNNSITFEPKGLDVTQDTNGPIGVTGQPGPVEMTQIEYRKFLRIRKVNKLRKIWDLPSVT